MLKALVVVLLESYIDDGCKLDLASPFYFTLVRSGYVRSSAEKIISDSALEGLLGPSATSKRKLLLGGDRSQ